MSEQTSVAVAGGATPISFSASLPEGLTAALNTEQAALYTGLAPATLEGLRCKGGGPRFVRYGRKAVRYLTADLDAWMARLTVSSTSEAA
jgi:predicted DNA-binding transcriptional regulator AlpA